MKSLPDLKYKKDPWSHQLQAILMGAPLNALALFMDMGTGKTGASINILRHWYARAGGIGKTLICCPPIVIKNWGEEFKKHSYISDTKILLLHGSGKKRVDDLCARKSKGDAFIVVTNYESLLMDKLFHELVSWGPDFFVWDESHKVKSPKSQRSKRAVQLVRSRIDPKIKGIPPVAARPSSLLLTGTPILNDPLDLFQQFMVMDLGATLGDNFYIYRARYFWDIMSGTDKKFKIFKIRKGAEDAINKVIKPKIFQAKKQECLDLPPFIQQTIRLPLAPCQKKIYRELKNDFVGTLSNDIVAADLAIVQGLRLLQMVSGFYVTIEGETKPFKTNPKDGALEELLETLCPNSKVIVWSVFKHNYKQIATVCKKLKIKYVEVHGGISAKNKDENVKKFNNDPEIRVLIGHPGSGGIGINLTQSDTSIFYSRSFSLEHSLQAEARNYRGGSEIHKKITRYDLVMEDTIDEIVTKKLLLKIKISNSVLKQISAEMKGGTNG